MEGNTFGFVAASSLHTLFRRPPTSWMNVRGLSLRCIPGPSRRRPRTPSLPALRTPVSKDSEGGVRGRHAHRRCKGTCRATDTTAGSRPPPNALPQLGLTGAPHSGSRGPPPGAYLSGAPGPERPLPVYHQPLPTPSARPGPARPPAQASPRAPRFPTGISAESRHSPPGGPGRRPPNEPLFS